jgi:lipoprotein-anchoring transpeptidase ErfK/SrfK
VLRSRTRLVALGTCLLVLAGACSDGERPELGEEVEEPQIEQRRLDPERTYLATAAGEVDVFADPADEEPQDTVAPPTAGTPVAGLAVDGFLVRAPYESEPGWHQVFLADGSNAWVRSEDVEVSPINVVAVGNGTEVDTSGGGGGEVAVFAQPDAPQPQTSITNPQSAEGLNVGPVVFLAKGPVDPTADWLEVHLPIRPNNSTGWVRRADVSLTAHNFRIDVMLSAHKIRVYEGRQRVIDEPIGVGTEQTPTPGGTFYIRSLIASTDPAYGTYAFGLSGFSEVHETFNGGPGDIGIHGTNDPSTIGTDVSNGCIRLVDEVVIRLATLLPEASGAQTEEPGVTTGLGVPVRVVA